MLGGGEVNAPVIIGNATLYCGDCRDILPSLPRIGAIVSDPPYGIAFVHSPGGHGIAASRDHQPIHGDDKPFDPAPWIELAPEFGKGEKRCVLWGADAFRARLPEYGTLLAWDKHVGRGADDSFADCEWAWCGRKVKREVFRWFWKGVTARRTKEDGLTRAHVSQKPVELMRWCIDKARPLTDLPVLDPYMGSGSTGVACATLGLPFIGIEVDAEHFATACERIEDAQRQERLIA
jgi:site-specific DNA-methyltransferase (adenine-specific)/modification methylase